MKQTYYSNGKLFITGEYVVLDGAKAFALPTRFGQSLIVEKGEGKQIVWKSFDSDKSVWFQDKIAFDEIKTEKATSEIETVKTTLIKILHEAYLLNPEFIEASEGYTITTELTFPRFWGLGTSSTLINNIAQWTNCDAFELLDNSFGGSGYDIACAQNDTPLLFWREAGQPRVEKTDFNPSFGHNLYFVYLNKKQSSKAAIASYYAKQNNVSKVVVTIDAITEKAIHAKDLMTFAKQLEKHEAIMSQVLEMETVKERFFHDFEGTVKSLGAWGGDFVLVASENDPTRYFEEKGYNTIIPFRKMCLLD